MTESNLFIWVTHRTQSHNSSDGLSPPPKPKHNNLKSRDDRHITPLWDSSTKGEVVQGKEKQKEHNPFPSAEPKIA